MIDTENSNKQHQNTHVSGNSKAKRCLRVAVQGLQKKIDNHSALHNTPALLNKPCLHAAPAVIDTETSNKQHQNTQVATAKQNAACAWPAVQGLQKRIDSHLALTCTGKFTTGNSPT